MKRLIVLLISSLYCFSYQKELVLHIETFEDVIQLDIEYYKKYDYLQFDFNTKKISFSYKNDGKYVLERDIFLDIEFFYIIIDREKKYQIKCNCLNEVDIDQEKEFFFDLYLYSYDNVLIYNDERRIIGNKNYQKIIETNKSSIDINDIYCFSCQKIFSFDKCFLLLKIEKNCYDFYYNETFKSYVIDCELNLINDKLHIGMPGKHLFKPLFYSKNYLETQLILVSQNRYYYSTKTIYFSSKNYDFKIIDSNNEEYEIEIVL